MLLPPCLLAPGKHKYTQEKTTASRGRRRSNRPLPLQLRQLPRQLLAVTALIDLVTVTPQFWTQPVHLEQERAGLEMTQQNLSSSNAPGSHGLSNQPVTEMALPRLVALSDRRRGLEVHEVGMVFNRTALYLPPSET